MVDCICGVEIYPYVPKFCVVDVKEAFIVGTDDKKPVEPRPTTVDTRLLVFIKGLPRTVGATCASMLGVRIPFVISSPKVDTPPYTSKCVVEMLETVGWPSVAYATVFRRRQLLVVVINEREPRDSRIYSAVDPPKNGRPDTTMMAFDVKKDAFVPLSFTVTYFPTRAGVGKVTV